MVFAILAAGEGSRLADEGLTTPKPLLTIQGKPMIDRLVNIFMNAGAEKIFVIANDIHKQTKEHIASMADNGLPVELIVKTTPSSMHSFFEIHRCLGQGKFCLTTVDTIFKEQEFYDFINAFKDSNDNGMMAVTDFVDDEKPLYISYDKKGFITGFHDSMMQFRETGLEKEKHAVCDVISGGIYCLDESCFHTLQWCMDNGMSRMRNFQRQLITDGLRLKTYKFSKILDVDHVDDIAKAEQFLA